MSVKPSLHERGDMTLTGLKNGRDTEGGADSLRQENLIVLGADGGHHDAKDVEDGSHKDEIARTVSVVELSDDGSLQESVNWKVKISKTYHCHHEKDL